MQFSVCFLALISLVNGETTLKLVNLLYRHGDRSPVVIFPKDPNKVDKWPQGLGWLTTIGMKQHYLLGGFLRRRYVNTGFLSREYKHTEIQIESSDENRCLMSAYCNLAGLYPPDNDQRFNQSLDWQPIPVHTRPAKEDNTLNMGENCPRYNEAFGEVYNSPEVQKEENENKGFYAWLGEKTGVDHENINNIWQIADTLFCEKSHNLTLVDWAQNATVYKKLRSLLSYQFELLYYTRELQRLKGGPLLGEMIDNMRNKTRKDKPISTRMFMYSAHDTTVASLLSALQVFNNISPPYAAMVILELHQNSTGNNFVKLYFKNSTTDQDTIRPLTIPGCTQNCPLESFIKLTKPVIPSDWLKECGLTNQKTGNKFSTAWIVVIVLAVLLLILLAINVVMYISYKRNNPGYKMERLTNA